MSKKHTEPIAETPADQPVAEPQAEYPKMLYIGPYRQQVTVCTAEEEAQWMQAHDEQMASPAAATGASASVPGVQKLGAPVDAEATDANEKHDDEKHDKKGKR